MSGSTFWPKKTIRGTTYDLSHLHPFVLDVLGKNPDAPILKVVVSFDLHTFTRERYPSDTDDLHMNENGNLRSFCIQRYGCSQYLPAMLRKAASNNVYFTYDRKFLYADTIPVVSGPYAAVFRLERSQAPWAHARMFVITAHERFKPLAEMKAISFYTLVRKIAADEPIPWPKKK